MSITVLTLPTGKIGFSVYFLSNVQALCRELASLWIIKLNPEKPGS